MSAICLNDHQNSDGSLFCRICGSPIEEVETRESADTEAATGASTPQEAQPFAQPGSRRSFWKQLPPWAKIAIPIGGALVVVGVVVAVALGARGPHVPTEADYRHAFEDIATVVNANGGNWETPATYPSPLSSWSEEKFDDVKTVVVDPQCIALGKGEDSMELGIDLAVAYAKDNGGSVDFTLVTRQAVIEVAAKYVCPEYADVAKTASGYINMLLVLGW